MDDDDDDDGFVVVLLFGLFKSFKCLEQRYAASCISVYEPNGGYTNGIIRVACWNVPNNIDDVLSHSQQLSMLLLFPLLLPLLLVLLLLLTFIIPELWILSERVQSNIVSSGTYRGNIIGKRLFFVQNPIPKFGFVRNCCIAFLQTSSGFNASGVVDCNNRLCGSSSSSCCCRLILLLLFLLFLLYVSIIRSITSR